MELSDQEFLRVKAQVAAAADAWRKSGQDNKFLLARGKPLAEAKTALQNRPSELGEVEFVQTSSKFAKRGTLKSVLLIVGIVLLVVGAIFGGLLWWFVRSWGSGFSPGVGT
jgi:hypothetical protein